MSRCKLHFYSHRVHVLVLSLVLTFNYFHLLFKTECVKVLLAQPRIQISVQVHIHFVKFMYCSIVDVQWFCPDLDILLSLISIYVFVHSIKGLKSFSLCCTCSFVFLTVLTVTFVCFRTNLEILLYIQPLGKAIQTLLNYC